MSIWASAFQNFLSIPSNMALVMIHFLNGQGPTISDASFKMATKILAVLFIGIAFVHTSNTLIRGEDMICHANTDDMSNIYHNYLTLNSSSSTINNNDPEAIHSAINDYCWNHGTFLVEKGLEPAFQHKVTYPGIIGYKNGEDDIIRQDYYILIKFIVPILGLLLCLASCTWNRIAVKKLRSLVDPKISVQQRVALFKTTIPFNSSYAAAYFIICKFMALICLVLTYFILGLVFGTKYLLYGYNVVMYYIKSTSNTWPNPIIILFPKMVKCEFNRFGYSGDVETMSIQCELPLNAINGPVFLFLWYTLFFVTAWNISSFIYVLIDGLSNRNKYYRKLLEHICKDELERARASESYASALLNKKLSGNDFVRVDVGFGDWLVLGSIKANLSDSQFMKFIHELALTDNSVLQIIVDPKRWHTEGNLDISPGSSSLRSSFTSINIEQEEEEPQTKSLSNEGRHMGFIKNCELEIKQRGFPELHKPKIPKIGLGFDDDAKKQPKTQVNKGDPQDFEYCYHNNNNKTDDESQFWQLENNHKNQNLTSAKGEKGSTCSYINDTVETDKNFKCWI